MGAMIEQRIKNIFIPQHKYQIIHQEEVVSSVASIRVQLSSDSSSMNKVTEEDFSNSDRSRILDWFQKIGKALKTRVAIYWLFQVEGVEMDFDDFASHFDDLWYPGADDVWITDRERIWVLELNHEEVFSLYISIKTA